MWMIPNWLELASLNILYSAVIIIKHASSFFHKVEDPYKYIRIFDLIDKCGYAVYDYDGSIIAATFRFGQNQNLLIYL